MSKSKSSTPLDQPVPVQENPEYQELDSKYKRALADYHNLVRQTQRQREEYVKFANQQLMEQLLPAFDSLELAVRHTEDQGITVVYKHILQILEQAGISKIDPQSGQPFDAHLHECVETIPTNDSTKHQTISELGLTGYQWQNGNIIRPAMVKVYALKTDSPKDSVDNA